VSGASDAAAAPEPGTPRCAGVILAGGTASRYGGRAKGLERVGGVRVIDRVAEALRAAADDLLLVANDPAARAWLPGVRVAGDVLRDVGSVAGIHAALHHAGGAALVVAWDMPFVPAALLRELRRLAQEQQADVAAPESDSRRGLEPLCAYYGPRCLPAIERAVARDDRRVVGFYADVRVARLAIEDVARFGDPSRIFMNVNTPEELGVAESYASAADGGGDRP
jgi:molybdopterin-guanine dinucleotide biosynthesis protein A